MRPLRLRIAAIQPPEYILELIIRERSSHKKLMNVKCEVNHLLSRKVVPPKCLFENAWQRFTVLYPGKVDVGPGSCEWLDGRLDGLL